VEVILPQQNQFQLATPLLFTLSHMYKHLIPQQFSAA